MVVFLDLDDDGVSDPDPHVDPNSPAGYNWALRQQRRVSKPHAVTVNREANITDEEGRANPNVNSLSAAFGCYP